MNTFPRSSGVLLHPTSLPGRSGNLGHEAFRFIDFLHTAGQRWWQMLPIGPAGACNSPYDSPSAFAGNPLLLGSEKSLRRRYQRFSRSSKPSERKTYAAFCRSRREWVDDYAHFRALQEEWPKVSWTDWPLELRQRQPKAMERSRRFLAKAIDYHRYVQFLFDRQWQALSSYAASKKIHLIGDLAIFVSRESADVWSHQHLFRLDRESRPLFVAGVPPDYFSQDGQRWGNPLYDWEAMRRNKYGWWIARMRRMLNLFDAVRLDHFIGFTRFWQIPADAPTAKTGRYVPGPGAPFFQAMERALGHLPIIAEDLGVLTPAVKALRERFGFPGMRVLQFAFGNDPEASNYQPHNYPSGCVVYTGTHDNDTTIGWFRDRGGKQSTRNAVDIRREHDFAMRYIPSNGREIHWDMTRLAFRSKADTAIIPAQDLLGLGSSARMNRPGIAAGNWGWKLRPGALTSRIAKRLHELTVLYGRAQ